MYVLLYCLEALLLIFGSLSIWSYVDTQEETSDSTYAKNISLSNLVVCYFFLFVILLMHFLKKLESYRLILISIFILLVSSILYALSYYFLEEERKSPSGYDTAYTNLLNNTNRYNIDMITLNVVMAIVGAVIILMILSYLYGKSKAKIAGRLTLTRNSNLVLNDNDVVREDNAGKTTVFKKKFKVKNEMDNYLGFERDDRIKRVLIL